MAVFPLFENEWSHLHHPKNLQNVYKPLLLILHFVFVLVFLISWYQFQLLYCLFRFFSPAFLLICWHFLLILTSCSTINFYFAPFTFSAILSLFLPLSAIFLHLTYFCSCYLPFEAFVFSLDSFSAIIKLILGLTSTFKIRQTSIVQWLKNVSFFSSFQHNFSALSFHRMFNFSI